MLIDCAGTENPNVINTDKTKDDFLMEFPLDAIINNFHILSMGFLCEMDIKIVDKTIKKE
jgi:hypothetical protein